MHIVSRAYSDFIFIVHDVSTAAVDPTETWIGKLRTAVLLEMLRRGWFTRTKLCRRSDLHAFQALPTWPCHTDRLGVNDGRESSGVLDVVLPYDEKLAIGQTLDIASSQPADGGCLGGGE
eukprot:COSAG02_NODE_9244_length_2279_cov_1.708716_2_plen_120_part_00